MEPLDYGTMGVIMALLMTIKELIARKVDKDWRRASAGLDKDESHMLRSTHEHLQSLMRAQEKLTDRVSELIGRIGAVLELDRRA